MNGKDFQFYKGEPLNLRRSARVFDGAEPRPDWQARAEAAEPCPTIREIDGLEPRTGVK